MTKVVARRGFALAAAAAVAGGMVLFSPGTASADGCDPKSNRRCWHVQINVTSIPSGNAGLAGSIWINNTYECVKVSGPGSHNTNTWAAAGQTLGLLWLSGSNCRTSTGLPPFKYVKVTDPAPNKNFWVTMSR